MAKKKSTVKSKSRVKAKTKPIVKAKPVAKTKSKPVAKTKPKPIANAAPVAKAKPVAKTKPKPIATPVAKTKPVATAKPVAKAKPAAAPKPRAVPRAKTVVTIERGSGLVELAIATDRERRSPTSPPHPLGAAQIAQLSMPDGREIPPSLAAWLAYDALDIFEGSVAAPRLRWRSFSDMMREQFDDQTAAIYSDFGKVLTGHCLVLPLGADSRRFLYAGEPDAHGEYPIFIVDTDELPWVGLAYAGFDAYIADGRVAKVVTTTYMDHWDHEHWAPHLEHHARRNFRGFKALDYQDPEHVDGESAARAAMAEIMSGDAIPIAVDDFDDFRS